MTQFLGHNAASKQSQQVLLAKKGKQERGGRESQRERRRREWNRERLLESSNSKAENRSSDLGWASSVQIPKALSSTWPSFHSDLSKLYFCLQLHPPPSFPCLAINYCLCLCCWPQLCDPKHNESLITRQLRLSLAPQTPIASQVPWTPSPVAAMSAQLCDTIAAFNCSTGFVLHKEECRGGRGEGEECWVKSFCLDWLQVCRQNNVQHSWRMVYDIDNKSVVTLLNVGWIKWNYPWICCHVFLAL